jgi:murein DD-endopeptidase MepM/ murein hydrolase activator NlpD
VRSTARSAASGFAIAIAIATIAAIACPSAHATSAAVAELSAGTGRGAAAELGTGTGPSTRAIPPADIQEVVVTADEWAWPVSAPHPIARPFIAPATPYSSGHRGIDIRAPTSEVFAPEGGIVSFAGMVAGRPVLSIRHPGGLVSSFEPVSSALSSGSAVSRGQLVGTLLPGHCAELCVHFGVRLNGNYVSPLNYLGSVPRAILLPTR